MNKRFRGIVGQHRQEIRERWHEAVLSVFPVKMQPESPISQALYDGLGELLDELVSGRELTGETMSGVIRILAVQNFPPSRAMSLFFKLKTIVWKIASADPSHRTIRQKDRDEFQADMEHLTLEAFDSYMEHREKIYQLKVEENRRQTFMMQRRVQKA